MSWLVTNTAFLTQYQEMSRRRYLTLQPRAGCHTPYKLRFDTLHFGALQRRAGWLSAEEANTLTNSRPEWVT